MDGIAINKKTCSKSKLKKNRSTSFDVLLASLMLPLNMYLLIGIEILLQFFKTSVIVPGFETDFAYVGIYYKNSIFKNLAVNFGIFFMIF